MAWNFKDISLAVILSYAIMTGLNYLAHQVFNIPILKTGVLIMFFMVGIILSTIFVFVRDGSFSAEDVKGLLVVAGVVIALFFAIKYFLPDLFSLLPNNLKENFSMLG